MFMVTNKRLTNALKERAKKGKIDIKLIADKSYDKAHQKISRVKKLVSIKNISLFHTKGLSKKKNKFGIMHAKLVTIDDDVVYIGSTNWTKSAFHSNYEILVKITDATTAKLYQYYFSDMLRQAQKYK
jgi:phosphatidylserine/phosphatidylglycerophosphate/cardiolipin synthase-like enzyme